MIKHDFHMHSEFSSDSTAPMSSMIESAIEKGLEKICFTEHMDFDFKEVMGMTFQVDTPEYMKALFNIKERYSSRIEVLFGIEIGVMSYLSERLEKYINSFPFDFVIASSHLVNGKDPYVEGYFDIGEKQGIDLYFQSIAENIKAFKNFDVYGHLDYVVRYVPSGVKTYNVNDYKDIIDEILKLLTDNGKGLEINTSGIKYGLGFAHPHIEILKRYRQLGGEIITVGADAHKPEHIAYSFNEVDDILKSAGFNYYSYFKDRRPCFVKI